MLHDYMNKMNTMTGGKEVLGDEATQRGEPRVQLRPQTM